MKFTGFLFLLYMGIISSSVSAGKLYKIIDENGNVTFSQFPPVPSEETKTLKIEEKNVINESKSTLVKKGDREFCGKIQLPRQREKKEYFFSEIANRMKYWEQDLNRKEEQLRKTQENYFKQSQYRSKYGSNSYQTSHYLESKTKSQESLKDLRCAITWGNKHQEGSVKAKDEMNSELLRLQTALSKHTDQRLSKCGEEPIYDPTIDNNKRLRKEWTKCSRMFKTDIRKLERLISNESRKLEKF